MSIISVFKTRQALIDFISDQQGALVDSSKQILGDKYTFEIERSNRRGTFIQPSTTLAHKQFFTLLLKKQWDTKELIFIIAFCAIIKLLNDSSTPSKLNETNTTLLKTLCEHAWETLYDDIIGKTRTRLTSKRKSFQLSGIEHVVDFSEPLEFIKRLPEQAYLTTWGDKNTQFIHRHPL